MPVSFSRPALITPCERVNTSSFVEIRTLHAACTSVAKWAAKKEFAYPRTDQTYRNLVTR